MFKRAQSLVIQGREEIRSKFTEVDKVRKVSTIIYIRLQLDN